MITIKIKCNFKGCREDLNVGLKSSKESVDANAIKSEGWRKTQRGKFYCPKHRSRKKRKVK